MAANTDTSSSSEEDDDGSIEDLTELFDSVALVEQEFVNEGKEEGSKHICNQAHNEGYDMGKQHGSKLGNELGFYNGFVSSMLFNDNISKIVSTRAEKLLSKLHLSLTKLNLDDKTLSDDKLLNTTLKVIRQNFQQLLQNIMDQENSNLSKQLKNILMEDSRVPLTVRQFLQGTTTNQSDNTLDPSSLTF